MEQPELICGDLGTKGVCFGSSMSVLSGSHIHFIIHRIEKNTNPYERG